MSTAKEIASGSLYSATEKAQTAKMPIKQSTPVQRYIVGPAVYVKECLAVVSAMVFRYVKSDMSLARFLLSVATVLVVLGCMTFGELSFSVSKVCFPSCFSCCSLLSEDC
jgi:hypothetical protein